MRSRLSAWLHKRAWLTFLLMGVFFLLKANIDLFLDYGRMVLADGALPQLAELIAYGYLSLPFYVLFKICEHVLVTHLADGAL